MTEAMDYLGTRLAAKTRTERGASAVEYGLLLALIALLIVGAVSLLGGQLSALFSHAGNSLPS
jgi:pilus assembly protein Flp/PilA